MDSQNQSNSKCYPIANRAYTTYIIIIEYAKRNVSRSLQSTKRIDNNKHQWFNIFLVTKCLVIVWLRCYLNERANIAYIHTIKFIQCVRVSRIVHVFGHFAWDCRGPFNSSRAHKHTHTFIHRVHVHPHRLFLLIPVRLVLKYLVCEFRHFPQNQNAILFEFQCKIHMCTSKYVYMCKYLRAIGSLFTWANTQRPLCTFNIYMYIAFSFECRIIRNWFSLS